MARGADERPLGRNGYVAILPGVELVAPVLSQPEFLIECGCAAVASAPISEMENLLFSRAVPEQRSDHHFAVEREQAGQGLIRGP